MASGKETSRQKMINLMYLVFIAMLALNMSKEVLSAFGMITEQTEDNTERLETRVLSFKQSIDQAVDDNVEGFDENFSNIADSIQLISDNFDNYISTLLPETLTKKIKIKKTDNKPSRDSVINDYEIMDKAEYFNDLWFKNSDGDPTVSADVVKGINNGESLGAKSGSEFVKKINEFRTEFVNLIVRFNPDANLTATGKTGAYGKIIDNVNDLFSTNGVVNREGQETSWLEYHYYGYPEIASKTKLAVMQSNIRSVQAGLYSAMLGGQYQIIASLANFDAYVVADRSSYFTGSNFTGKIVLGKKSDDLTVSRATINGNLLNTEESINEDGSISLDFPAGRRANTEDIIGEVVFLEDGQEVSIPVKSSYQVVDKPSSASISADKMRVFYRGVPNPISVTVAGVSDNNVRVTAPGIKKIGPSSYNIDLTTLPEELSGKQKMSINVNASLEGGENIRSSTEFKIYSLPTPIAYLNGDSGAFSTPKAAVQNGTFEVGFSTDFAYELNLRVTSFVLVVPGQPELNILGGGMNADALNMLKGVKNGQSVIIRDIKVNADETRIPINDATPLIIKIQG